MAEYFIDSVCQKLVSDKGLPFVLSWSDASCTVQYEKGHIRILDSNPPNRLALLRRLCASSSIGLVLVDLMRKTMRPSRFKGQIEIITALKQGLTRVMATSIEASRRAAVWDETRVCDVASLVRANSSKVRRVGIGYICDVCDAADETPELHSASQLVAAKGVMSGQASTGKQLKIKFKVKKTFLKPKSAKSFVVKRMWSYNSTAKARAGKSLYRSVGLDGVRAGGAEWVCYASTDPKSGVSHWLPPGVPWLFFQVPRNRSRMGKFTPPQSVNLRHPSRHPIWRILKVVLK